MAEDEIVDEYLSGKLGGSERAAFEKHFLATPERHDKLRFGRAFNRFLSSRSPIAPERQTTISGSPWAFSRILSSPLRIGIAAVVIIGAAFGVWRVFFHQSEVDKGLLALNAAYREQRPLESRISRFDYAPYVTTRGSGPEKINQNELLRAQLTLLDALNKNPTPAVRHALGKVFLAKKEFDQAIEQFDEALKGDPKNAQLHSDLGAAWLEKGRINRDGKNTGKGMEELGRSLQSLTKALELNPNLLEALFNRALVYQNMRLSPQAIDAWRKYLELDSNSYWAVEARKNLELLTEQEKAAKNKKTELYETFRSAYHLRDNSTAWSAIARSQSRLGNYIVQRLVDEHLRSADQGDAKEADDRLRMLSFAGEVESQTVGDLYTADLAATYNRATADQRQKLGTARSLVVLGNQSYDKSEYEPAIESYQRALEQFEKEGDSCEALLTNNLIGYSELRLAKVDSHERFQRLSAMYEQKGYKSMLAQVLHAESDFQTSSNELSKVLEQARKALQQAEMVQDDTTRLRCLQQFVSMNLKFGNYLASLGHGALALDIAQSVPPNPRLVWTFYHEMALDFYWLNLFDAALEFEQEALRQAKRSESPLLIVRSHTQLGVILEKRGENAAAIQSGVLAVEHAQTITGERSRLNVQSHALMRLGHLYRQSGDFTKALESYGRALEMFRQLNLGMFLYEAHKGRFMALAQLGQTSAAEEELTQTLQLFEQYRTKIQDEQNRNSFFDVGQPTYDLAIDFAFSQQADPARAFDYAERSRARSLLGLTRAQGNQKPDSSSGPLTLSEIQTRLPQSVEILQYSMLPDKLIIWVVSRTKIESRSISISSAELGRRVSELVQLTTNRASTEETKNAAKELYEYLVTPVESSLVTNDEICLVPDRALSQLPFGSLVSPDGRYFVEKFSYIFSSSSNVFISSTDIAAIREKQPAAAEKLLSVGNPAFAQTRFPDLSDLPSAANEARQIAAYYKTEALTGGLAQESRIRAVLPRVEVAHFAAHFVADPKSPEQSGLVLAEVSDQSPRPQDVDGVLQAFEIERMKLSRTRLVVLSACQTGIERTYQGEGAISVARSFIVAGVPLVVATLWPVESDAAAVLMIRFHAYRKLRGLSTVAALRQAQLSMLKDDNERYRRPADWAPFAVFGGYANF